jgi:hypothetical protein
MERKIIDVSKHQESRAQLFVVAMGMILRHRMIRNSRKM